MFHHTSQCGHSVLTHQCWGPIQMINAFWPKCEIVLGLLFWAFRLEHYHLWLPLTFARLHVSKTMYIYAWWRSHPEKKYFSHIHSQLNKALIGHHSLYHNMKRTVCKSIRNIIYMNKVQRNMFKLCHHRKLYSLQAVVFLSLFLSWCMKLKYMLAALAEFVLYKLTCK
jgi:hypothetical protein